MGFKWDNCRKHHVVVFVSLFVSLQLTGCEFNLDLSTPNPGVSKAEAFFLRINSALGCSGLMFWEPEPQKHVFFGVWVISLYSWVFLRIIYLLCYWNTKTWPAARPNRGSFQLLHKKCLPHLSFLPLTGSSTWDLLFSSAQRAFLA